MTEFLNHRATLWLVALLASVLFAVANLPWHLDEYDQAKQAFTSFEMVTQGNWFYQHTPNGWVATKPPLIGWISAGLFEVTRSWELAWLLPSFIAAIVLFFLIARAASVYGTIASVVAAAAFSLNMFSPRLATLVRTDMPLALLIFAIGLLIWNDIRQRKLPNTRDRLILFVLLSATMLTKGPIVIAFLLPGIVAFQVRAQNQGRTVDRMVGLVAVAGVAPDLSDLVDRRNNDRGQFLGTRRRARICRSFWRSRASTAADLFLSAAFPASLRAVESPCHSARESSICEGRKFATGFQIARRKHSGWWCGVLAVCW